MTGSGAQRRLDDRQQCSEAHKLTWKAKARDSRLHSQTIKSNIRRFWFTIGMNNATIRCLTAAE